MPVRSSEVAVMTGTHFHSLDEKGRVIIPAKLRSALTEQFWMMLDEHDNICLYNYKTGLSVLERCEQLMAEKSVDGELALSIERITNAMPKRWPLTAAPRSDPGNLALPGAARQGSRHRRCAEPRGPVGSREMGSAPTWRVAGCRSAAYAGRHHARGGIDGKEGARGSRCERASDRDLGGRNRKSTRNRKSYRPGRKARS